LPHAMQHATQFIVGGSITGDYAHALYKQYAHRWNITFRGHVEAPPFLASIDVLVVPTLGEEAFGGVALEAMQQGAPILYAASGAFPDLVADAVWSYPRNRPHVLAQHMLDVMHDDSLYRAAHSRCQQRAQMYTAETIAKQSLRY